VTLGALQGRRSHLLRRGLLEYQAGPKVYLAIPAPRTETGHLVRDEVALQPAVESTEVKTLEVKVRSSSRRWGVTEGRGG
jgi:hypothetical protein